MRHLSPEEVVDVAEGCAEPSRAAHASACESCRANVEATAEAVRLAGTDAPPEPSPLFWPHLAARIGEAVRREQLPGPSRGLWVFRLVPVAAVAVAVVAVSVGIKIRSGVAGRMAPAPTAAQAAAVSGDLEPAAENVAPDDPSWLLVSDLSADADIDAADLSGGLVLPGGVERALLQLDRAERVELARILREELAPSRPAGQGPGA